MIKFTIAFIIIGLMIFTSMATFNVEAWDRSYFIWDKGKDVLLAYLVWQLSIKRYGHVVQPLFWFMVVRFWWDIISWGTALSVNDPKIIGILFILYSLYVFYKAITDVRN